MKWKQSTVTVCKPLHHFIWLNLALNPMMAPWRGCHTLICALALLSSPSVVCRLQSGPRGMRDFNLSKHRRRCARLCAETQSRWVTSLDRQHGVMCIPQQLHRTDHWITTFYRLMYSCLLHWPWWSQIVLAVMAYGRRDTTIWLLLIDSN